MFLIFSNILFSTKLENHQRAIHTCSKIFCISQSTKRDYLKFVPEMPEDRLVVALEAANARFCKAKTDEITNVKKKHNINGNYISVKEDTNKKRQDILQED